MIKHTVKYKDLDDNDVVEDLYFHLTKADLAKMALGDDDLEARIRRMIETKNSKAIIEEFETIIRMAFGRRSEDNRSFIRDNDTTDRFMLSEAYSALFMDLMTDANKASAFIRGMIPKGLSDNLPTILELPEDTRPAWEREERNPTEAELINMSKEELQRAFRSRR